MTLGKLKSRRIHRLELLPTQKWNPSQKVTKHQPIPPWRWAAEGFDYTTEKTWRFQRFYVTQKPGEGPTKEGVSVETAL